MSSPASSKRVCAKYERGECDGSCCPYFHPKDLAGDKPAQPAQEEATPAANEQPEEPTPNPTEPTPKLAPQSPMDDTESNLNDAPTPISTRPQTPPGPCTLETPHKNNKRKKKKVQKAENSTTEATIPPEGVSPKRGSIRGPPAQPGQYICKNYLQKKCSRDPCPNYHDPELADKPPLCLSLYNGPCTKNACKFYHPEHNRDLIICKNSLNSKCAHKNCRRYHFRLPAGEGVTPVSRESSFLLGGGDLQQVTPSISQSLSSSTSSTHGTDDGSQRPQCSAWNDGYCPKGKNCKMPHLSRAMRWQMEEETAAAKTTDRVIFDNTKVVFGAGCEIKQVTTALESFRVLISNLPERTTKEALEDYLTRGGFNREDLHIPVLRVSADRETQEASVVFYDAEHAKAVVEALDKKKHFGKVLKFELAPIVTAGQMDYWTYNRSSYLEITFNAPSKKVQAIYPTVEDAIAKARALNGRECSGRIVRVAVTRPPKPHEAPCTYIKNSIVISNVAIDTSESDILRFAEPFSMKMFDHRRLEVVTALQRLKDHMRTVGRLKPSGFSVVQDFQKGTIFVRGRFDTWEQADKVWQSLQESQLDFLARDHTQIFLAFPHQYSLHIPSEQYDAQKEVYDKLESQYGRDRTAHIAATRYKTVCLIQVVGTDNKAVGALKLKVEKIARGEVVEVWDGFFLDQQGEAFFGRLLRKFEAYVCPDETKQVLKVYGSEKAVNHARREIAKQMKKLAILDHQTTIEDRCVGFFVDRGMRILGDMFGEGNIWLQTMSKPYFVSVRGGHDAEHALQGLVDEALKKPLRPPGLDRTQTCPLCFREPIYSIPLGCRHVYCTGCLGRMLISATDGRSIPICCIGDEGLCKTPIPLPVIERFISPARLTKMLENTFRVYLEQHPDEYRFCPTPDCTQIYRVSTEGPAVIQCPACLTETCSHCHESLHRELACGPLAGP